GRLLRARGLTVGVGWTVPAECNRQNSGDAACDALKHSGRALAAELDTRRGLCASACVYAVLGGAVRALDAGVRLGIHDTSMPATIRSFDENGHVADVSTRLSADDERRALEAGQRIIGAHLEQMGISADLLKAAHAISRDNLRLLTRDEIFAFGIDRREAVESAWSPADKSPAPTVIKLVEARNPQAGAFRKAMLSLACHGGSTVRLQYIRDV